MCSSDLKLPHALPHSAITEVFPNVFMVTGAFIANYGGEEWQFSRNMSIIREGDQLTLVNAIRLDEAGLAALEQLGKVKHVVKLGAAHGIDNAFYALRYDAKVWALPGAEHEHGINTNEVLTTEHLPFTDALLHVLAEGEKAEAVMVVQRDGGILLTCDSVKNWAEVDPYFSAESGAKMSQYGMIVPTSIDANWAKTCGITRESFDNMLKLPFQHMIPGHGLVVKNDAQQQISNAVKQALAS